MKKKTVSAAVAAAAVLLLAAPLAQAFDWPQEGTTLESFFSYFGQLRGGRIEASLIFNDDAEVRAAGDGEIIAVIHGHNNDFGWFESTLGNAVIVEHKDNIATVYGNLDEDSLPGMLEQSRRVQAGNMLGTSGNSGWQEGQSCLEFLVLDTKNRAAVNPRILMPRTSEDLPLVIGELTMDDRNGTTHHLLNERTLSSGTYQLYHTRQNTAVPYRTIVSINGTTVESISYDMLHEDHEQLCAAGNANYPVERLYPDEKRQLLSVLRLNRGHTTRSVTLLDILGKAQTITYNLEIN